MTHFKSVVAMLKKASFMGAFFLLLSCGSAAATSLCSIKEVSPEYAVRNVVDGDTIRLQDNRRVRLIGINAPELDGRGRTAEPYAVQAKRRLTALIKANNNKVSLRVGEQTQDRYGRMLVNLYDRNGVSLEEQMVAEGLAYHVVIAPNVALADCLAQAERYARRQRLGLWQSAGFISTHELNQGGFTLLQGRIQNVQRNRGGVWLELEHSVSVNIPLSALPYFPNERFAQWQGRRLKARGWVSERRGQSKKYAKWRLLVSHPAMLELQ